MTGRAEEGTNELFRSARRGGVGGWLMSAVCLGLWSVLSLGVLVGVALPLSTLVTPSGERIAGKALPEAVRPLLAAAEDSPNGRLDPESLERPVPCAPCTCLNEHADEHAPQRRVP